MQAKTIINRAAARLAGYQLTALARAIAPSRYVSVLDFGADPIGLYDSSAAFQRAEAAAGSGGVVHVPTGTYRVFHLQNVVCQEVIV